MHTEVYTILYTKKSQYLSLFNNAITCNLVNYRDTDENINKYLIEHKKMVDSVSRFVNEQCKQIDIEADIAYDHEWITFEELDDIKALSI